MTASMVRERAPERARPGRWAAHRSREALVFGGATAVAPLHALDDAIFHRQPGVGLGQHALLLVSARGEYDYGVAYDRAAGDRPVEHWHLPHVSHTDAIRQAAPQYERRVTRFFDQTLRKDQR